MYLKCWWWTTSELLTCHQIADFTTSKHHNSLVRLHILLAGRFFSLLVMNSFEGRQSGESLTWSHLYYTIISLLVIISFRENEANPEDIEYIKIQDELKAQLLEQYKEVERIIGTCTCTCICVCIELSFYIVWQ